MTYLLLHGGAGPASVAGFASMLSATGADVRAPAHPGFDGTPRPPELTTIRGLARHYAELLEKLSLDDVCVVGNSIGGWIAAELALLRSPRVSRLVIVDGVGIEVPGHPIADFWSLTFDQVAALSYADPARFAVKPPPSALQNRETLQVYASAMADPSLRDRLSAIDVPSLVIWGEADRIADAEYGKAFAAAIPGAEFLLLENAGHLPQIEAPDRLLKAVRDFAAGSPAVPGRPRR